MNSNITVLLVLTIVSVLTLVQGQNVKANLKAHLPNDPNFEQHPCRRECKLGESMVCSYKLVIHSRQILGPECRDCEEDPTACEREECIFGDGVANNVMTVNNVWPAPAIVVCENDVIVADVLNLLDENTTIHSHGMYMKNSKDMDGAPLITQYPIAPGETFQYEYPVDRIGTNWYHSHMGWQRALGVSAPLIIRQPKETDPFAEYYDYDLIEHTLMITDMPYNAKYNVPGNIFINGKGRNPFTPWSDSDERNRYERLQVQRGKRYLMRFISNGVSNCPFEVSIEKHRFLVIATDGNYIEPMMADNFFLTSAERLDIILETDQEPGKYWIKVQGHFECQNLYQGAVLEYTESSDNSNTNPSTNIQNKEKPASRSINILSEFQKPPPLGRAIKINDIPTVGLRSLNPLPWPVDMEFLTYYTSFGLHRSPSGVSMQADDITFLEPKIPLLLAENNLEGEQICNSSNLMENEYDCIGTHCKCTNIKEVPADRGIELIVANYMGSTHPFHLHGYSFRVVGQKSLGSVQELRKIRELNQRGLLERVPNDYPAIEKDTAQIPPLGYIIIRFISDNTGYWLYHCHIERHAINGMMGVIHVS